MPNLQLDKLTVATMQLNSAIRLFFEDRDPVSVHTLVCASLEILQKLINDRSKIITNQLVIHPDTMFVNEEYRKEYKRIISKNRNFFKHADRDRKDIIKFNTEINELYIFEAYRTFLIVSSIDVLSVEMQTFYIWFFAHYKDIFTDEYKELANQTCSQYGLYIDRIVNFDKSIFLEMINKSNVTVR